MCDAISYSKVVKHVHTHTKFTDISIESFELHENLQVRYRYGVTYFV